MRHMCVWSFVVCMLCCGVALGQDSKKSAQAVFTQGIELYEKGLFAEAAKAFTEANEIQFNWKVLYNIGQCEAAAKRNGQALEAFEKYLTMGGDDIPLERMNEVLAEVSRLKQIVGFLEIEAPEGAHILVDDELRAVAPTTGLVGVSAGVEHRIVVTLNGEELLQRTVRMMGGQQKSIVVEATASVSQTTVASPEKPAVNEDDASEAAQTESPIPPRSDQKSEPSSPGMSGLKKAGIATLVIGGTLTVAGLVVGGVGLSKAKTLDTENPDGVPPSRYNEYDRAYTLANVANVMVGVGAGTAVAGIVLLAVNRKKQEHANLTITPVGSSQHAGILVGGQF